MARTYKPLLPTQKEKKRYIAYEAHSDKKLPANVGRRILKELESALGIYDSAEAGLKHITYNSEEQKGIIRTSNAKTKRVRQAMLLTAQVDGQNIMIQPLITSGILKKAKALVR